MARLETLDPDEIVKTAKRVRARIEERFPRSGLRDVSDQLVQLASRARRTCQELRQPNRRLRIASYVVIALMIVVLFGGAAVSIFVMDTNDRPNWADLVQALDAMVNGIVMIGAAIFFFVSFETRFKRGKVVKALHELRMLAHLIDVHQLTKSPELVGIEFHPTKSSPKRTLTPFLLGRYLDYCSEMLSLTAKIAALYGDGFTDSESLEAVNEIEDLTIGLQSKIWQKIMLLRATTDDARISTASAPPVEKPEEPQTAAPETQGAGASGGGG